jgi:hypothetical protein
VSSFEEDCAVSLDFIKKIDSFLYGVSEFYLIPYVNIHTLFIETSKQKNSNLIIMPRGCSKSTFLFNLADQHPKWFYCPPSKMFESQLVSLKKNDLHMKVCVHDDLIIAFLGLTKKQREQLIGFWTKILSDGNYERLQNKDLIDVTTVSVFGLARESFDEHRKNFVTSTLMDRMVPIHLDFNNDEKKEILRFRKVNLGVSFPKIKIKSHNRKKPVVIDVPIEFNQLIDDWAMELDGLNVVSFARAQDYITNFLKAHAYLNEREKVGENDVKMYKKLHFFHIDSRDLTKIDQLVSGIKRYQNLNHDRRIEALGWSRATYFRYLKMAKNRGLVD